MSTTPPYLPKKGTVLSTNPTAKDILHSLLTGEGILTRYYEYVKGEGKSTDHGLFPYLWEELPVDAPKFVRDNAETSPYPEDIVSEFVVEDPSDYTVLGLTPETIENEGGEGQGDLAWVVIKVGDYFFRADYTYASWDGFYYDGSEFRQVHPVTKTIVEYE